MRVPSAYLAGFGTSGSLLAGAAALFVVASAVIAFHGWPEIATGPATTNVAASGTPAPSRAARRLAAAISGQRLAGLRNASTRSRGGATSGTRRASAAGGRRGAVRVVNTTSGGTGPATGNSAASCAPGACSRTGTLGAVANQAPVTSQAPITKLTNAVSRGVSSIGNSVGRTINRTAGTVAGTTGTVSQPASNVVQGAGSTATGAVSGASGTVAGAVSQAGTTLAGH